MNLFTISQLHQYSGIKPYTIRKWEERYNALTPTRSTGNTRYYDDNQLKKLLNIVQLKNSGLKISAICMMNQDEILCHLDKLYLDNTNVESKEELVICGLLEAGISYDEEKFNYIFAISEKLIGFEQTYTNVILPLLNRIGLLWAKNDALETNEHFISHLIIRKIYAAIDNLPDTKKSQNRWLLFLPEDEFHEIGLLISYYLLKKSGHSCIYLGPNLPDNNLSKIVLESRTTNILTFITHDDRVERIEYFVNHLLDIADLEHIWIAGSQVVELQQATQNKLKFINTFEKLKKLLN